MSSVRTETETVIKRILPYLRRRGYSPESDIDFETPVANMTRYSKGYVDLLVNCGKPSPQFVIEAKRNGKRLTAADAKQAIGYGKSVNVPFVVVTNGQVVQVYNTRTGEAIRWNGRLADKIPSRDQLDAVIKIMRTKADLDDVPLGSGDASLPFRPSLPLKQLNDLFSRCHNKIRNIEKNEEHAFADFSKILFLKLLEEKHEANGFALPYSWRFWALAEKPEAEADQVKSAIQGMLQDIKKLGYGDVLNEDLHLKQNATYRYLVQELAKVSFADSDHDVKGTAFEYFVRATLKGKKLGQYFTPRPVVELMVDLIGNDAVVGALRAGSNVRVADPACGTGGFLVYMLNSSLLQLDHLLVSRKISRSTHDDLARKIRSEVFHGGDANEGVAAAAKMNMIIAGDGHTNIRCENSLTPSAALWPIDESRYDYILTNPPFGTTEGDSLSRVDMQKYPIGGGYGQHLFLQRMILATRAGGYICTVIDEGLLNTDSGAALRRWAMQHCELVAVIQLPEQTFKPNKINVRSSIIFLRRRDVVDTDLLSSYATVFVELASLGYHSSGESIRGFDFVQVRRTLVESITPDGASGERSGPSWRSFDVDSVEIAEDGTCRWDRKYWDSRVRYLAGNLAAKGGRSLKELNTVETKRGASPASSLYVDEAEGFAVVVKAGSCINRFGEVVIDSADWIEKSVFDDMREGCKLQVGDVLIASTGDGTLGKTAVWRIDTPAVADSHVTIIRVDSGVIDPDFLADVLRCGPGQQQIERLYTGSTGLIELTPEHVDSIVVPLLANIATQRAASKELRSAEAGYRGQIELAHSSLLDARVVFEKISDQEASDEVPSLTSS